MEKTNLQKIIFKLLTLGIAIFALTFSVINSQSQKDKKKKKKEIIFDSSKSGLPKDLMKPKEDKKDIKQEQIDKSKEKQPESKDESQNKRDVIMPSSKAPAPAL